MDIFILIGEHLFHCVALGSTLLSSLTSSPQSPFHSIVVFSISHYSSNTCMPQHIGTELFFLSEMFFLISLQLLLVIQA